MPGKSPCVYILASKPNGTIYIGVTSDLHGRLAEHVQKLRPGFSAKYNVTRLVFYQHFDVMDEAIAREKQLKHWNRIWKIRLIEEMNPAWDDLFDQSTGDIRSGPFDPASRTYLRPLR